MFKRQRISVKRLIKRFGTPATLNIVTNKDFNIRTGNNSNIKIPYIIHKVLKLTNTLYRSLTIENVFLDFNKTIAVLTKNDIPDSFTEDLEHEFIFNGETYKISQIQYFPDLEVVAFELENLD
jgi:hypothetical protein